MKKKIIFLSLALVLCTAIGGSLAFSTSVQDDTNVLTTGRVDIKQHEYERVQNAKGEYVSTQVTDRYGYVPDKIKPFTQGKDIEPAYYVDGKVKWDDRNGSTAATGSQSHQQSWLQVGAEGSNQLFDSSVRNVIDKFVFVENVGRTNAYYRTIIALECPEGFDASLIHVNINGNSKFKWDNLGYVNISGTRYYLKVATYKEVLTPGETSRPSLLQVYLDPKTTNADMDLLGKTFDILVKTQATQAISGVDSSTVLDDAFGNIIENLPWDEVVIPCIIENEKQLRNFLKEGGSCVLSKDIIITGDLTGGWNALPTIKNETILNLNGHTIKNDTTTSNNFNMTLVGSSSGKLTLTGNGRVEFTNNKKSNGSSAAVYATATSNIIIEDGTYISDGSKYNIAVWAQDNSIVTINGGTFKNTNEVSDLIYAVGNATIYINGGFFESASAANSDTLNIMGDSVSARIIISGGTFVNDDPSVEPGDDENKIIIAEGYKVISETQTNGDVWYMVVPE